MGAHCRRFFFSSASSVNSGARVGFRRALASIEKSAGPENPFTAGALANLAELLQEEGRHAEAEPLLHRVLAITEKAEGPESSDTGRALNSLAYFFKSQERVRRGDEGNQ